MYSGVRGQVVARFSYGRERRLPRMCEPNLQRGLLPQVNVQISSNWDLSEASVREPHLPSKWN